MNDRPGPTRTAQSRGVKTVHVVFSARGVARSLVAMVGLAIVGEPAYSQSTTTYSYDALGRLTQSNVSGGQQNGTVSATKYDLAGNRVTYQVTGAPAGGSQPTSGASTSTMRVIVVPLNGFTVIPIP